MKTLYQIEYNLDQLKKFAKKLALKSNQGDIYLLKGELGVGKTTFTRFLINSIFDAYKIKRPENIKSPSYPILINYPLLNFEINHHDFYRLTNNNELSEIVSFEDFNKNISIIEWPEIIFVEPAYIGHAINRERIPDTKLYCNQGRYQTGKRQDEVIPPFFGVQQAQSHST